MNNFLQFLENFGKDHNHLSLEVQLKKRDEQVAVYHPKKRKKRERASWPRIQNVQVAVAIWCSIIVPIAQSRSTSQFSWSENVVCSALKTFQCNLFITKWAHFQAMFLTEDNSSHYLPFVLIRLYHHSPLTTSLDNWLQEPMKLA